jgi:hypothetical protein
MSLGTVGFVVSAPDPPRRDLQAFLTVWAGLEVLFDKAFAVYKPQAYA